MRKPRFKVGDKVKVIRASTDAEHDLWRDLWMTRMNNVIGEICVIIECDSNKCWGFDELYPKYVLDKCELYFPEFVLQNQIRIGQQLLFDFAKE